MTKPFSPSSERNQEPILEVLKKLLSPKHKKLLELGSGTGQHAIYLAPKFPELSWTCSDLEQNHHGIKLWLEDCPAANINGPISYEIGKHSFPDKNYDVVFSANTFHIMSWDKVKLFIQECGINLKPEALVIIYGPFNYNGSYSSESNTKFDIWLKDRNPESAIRDFEAVSEEMEKAGLKLQEDFSMPANNRILAFRRVG